MVTSADSCRTGEIESVVTVELVYVGGLLRTVVNIYYCLCEDLLELGSLAKKSWMSGQSGQLPDGQKTSMGAEWATSHNTPRVTNLFYLIAMGLECGSDGRKGSRVS